MFTYDVVSESVRNPHELAAELTRRSSQGWEVVHIAYDGAAWFHAFIRHAGSVPITTHPGMKAEQIVSATGTPVATAATPTTFAAPANWYKDPSGRFELRYWNGSAWTEHVATGGKQSTDQPQS
jgi:hypothetical protein